MSTNKNTGQVREVVGVKDASDVRIDPATEQQIGEVQASPTQHTVLDRLKTINDTLGSLAVTADLTGDHADLDSGAGTDDHEVVAIGLPGAGGHVVGGTATNPLTVTASNPTADPTTETDDGIVAAGGTHDSAVALGYQYDADQARWERIAARNTDHDASPDQLATIQQARLYGLNGVGTWDRLSGDTANGLDVDVTRVAGTVAVSGPLTEAELTAVVPDEVGTWGYNAGISGSVVLSGSKRVLQITAYSTSGTATVTINGGDTITVAEGASFDLAPRGNLVDPTVVFTGTTGYFIEHLS